MKSTEYAHHLWRQWITPGDCVIDATCGNGHDAFALARLLKGQGVLAVYDIQEIALEKTSSLLDTLTFKPQIFYHHKSHEEFVEKEANAIVYNLGYLPGSDKSLTTLCCSTLKSISQACHILAVGGFISVMLYPGHEEGEKEEKFLLDFVKTLPASRWNVMHHKWLNRQKAPSLLLMQKLFRP